MLAIALLFLCRFCHAVLVAEEIEYNSPQGTNTIIVSYDHVCRPTVYKKRWLWREKIFDYPSGGFMETVHFDVTWLSEKEILFPYAGYKKHPGRVSPHPGCFFAYELSHCFRIGHSV